MRAFLIDDDDGAANSAQIFSTEMLTFEFKKPETLESFAKELFCAKPGMIVVDYRLDERVGDKDQAVSYKASTLAQYLRDLAGDGGSEDFPIVLHSAEEKIREYFHPEKTAHDLFDHIIKKSSRKDVDEEKRKLDALADGYVRLLELRPYNDKLLVIFGLDKQRAHLIDHQEIHDLAATTTIPHIFARFILKRLISRNGILVDDLTVLARCGVNANDDGNQRIFDELQRLGANYTGVFSGFRSMWWRLTVEIALEEWLGGVVNSFSAQERAAALKQKFGYDFKPAKSAWSNSSNERFTHVCSICERPTLVAHSVAVHERLSGPLIERRRICFNCIQEDRHMDRIDLRIDALDKPVEDAVRKGTIQGEQSGGTYGEGDGNCR